MPAQGHSELLRAPPRGLLLQGHVAARQAGGGDIAPTQDQGPVSEEEAAETLGPVASALACFAIWMTGLVTPLLAGQSHESHVLRGVPVSVTCCRFPGVVGPRAMCQPRLHRCSVFPAKCSPSCTASSESSAALGAFCLFAWVPGMEPRGTEPRSHIPSLFIWYLELGPAALLRALLSN